MVNILDLERCPKCNTYGAKGYPCPCSEPVALIPPYRPDDDVVTGVPEVKPMDDAFDDVMWPPELGCGG